VFGSYPSDHQAESVRRRIHRGGGAWVGGRALWSVVIRKLGDDEWLVYVAFRNEAMGVAS
jgi:ribulose 1,5-bisphosphate synthetase/thiazole synthase